jgi:alkyl sulfatase BDS1-like metallo-beta-lactamase superfamily hydrolase
MGGADSVIAKSKRSFDAGDYRWVAEVMNHVVFSDPTNQAARNLEADALEQLGYQSESGPWRNFYLTGAQELRNGIPDYPAPNMRNPYMLDAMSVDMLFDYFGMTLNGPKAEGKEITINWTFTDTGEEYCLFLKNSALNHSNKHHENADATVTLKRSTLDEIMAGKMNMKKAVLVGKVKIKGKDSIVHELFEMMDKFDFWFPIVTP